MHNKTNKTLVGVLVVLIVIAGVLAWFVFFAPGSGGNVSQGDCQSDIQEAENYAEGRVCTQQFKRLQCPSDEGVVHGAPNGCVISELERRGWTGAPSLQE